MSRIIVLISIVFLFSGCFNISAPGSGYATDSIARVSEAGYVWKTWRVELTNDHPISGVDGGIIWQRYGVEHDNVLLSRLQTLAGSGKRVRLGYESRLFIWDWDYSDSDVIISVEEVNDME